MKTCSRCKQEKEDIEFSPDKRTKSGLHSYCKTCRSNPIPGLEARIKELEELNSSYEQIILDQEETINRQRVAIIRLQSNKPFKGKMACRPTDKLASKSLGAGE